MGNIFVIQRPDGTPFYRDDAMGILATDSEAQAIRFAYARENEGAEVVRYIADKAPPEGQSVEQRAREVMPSLEEMRPHIRNWIDEASPDAAANASLVTRLRAMMMLSSRCDAETLHEAISALSNPVSSAAISAQAPPAEVGDMLYRINTYCLTGGLSDADFRSNAQPILEDIRGYLSGIGYEIEPEVVTRERAPSEAVAWRALGKPCSEGTQWVQFTHNSDTAAQWKEEGLQVDALGLIASASGVRSDG